MTIYALSSGPGVSGIAVIRLSGKVEKEIIKIINKWSTFQNQDRQL